MNDLRSQPEKGSPVFTPHHFPDTATHHNQTQTLLSRDRQSGFFAFFSNVFHATEAETHLGFSCPHITNLRLRKKPRGQASDLCHAKTLHVGFVGGLDGSRCFCSVWEDLGGRFAGRGDAIDHFFLGDAVSVAVLGQIFGFFETCLGEQKVA
jgi:hypothetical protein